MPRRNRRQALKEMGAACAAALLLPKSHRNELQPLRIAAHDVEVQIAAVSAHTVRLSLLPTTGDQKAIPSNGSLAEASWGPPLAKLRGAQDFVRPQVVKSSKWRVKISYQPLTLTMETSKGEKVQQLVVDQDSGHVSFLTGNSPLLGLGEGGPQFDRRGSTDRMRSGQGGYRLGTHGGRVPIPWLVGTAGWALFFHQPFGTFDFTGSEGKFLPATPEAALPLDVFVVAAREPATIMEEYARLTGYPELPPLWSFGYQQSHRTLASREEILAEAKTFREKKLPCDTLIYLGTGFCPSGWNTQNGSFEWNKNVFPDPKEMIEELHKDHFQEVFHVVIKASQLRGTVGDRCDPAAPNPAEEVACYWDTHRSDFALGVDGWWPDEGDPLDLASRLVRNRMYWEGPQLDRPNERPYALHRNGAAGMQRYASFLWSGDVYSRWETLKTHVPVAINTALSGIPYWGTDIGGFVPTKEFTAELYLRWFQFGAFCTLFRSHGRNWTLRLPWGWNTGDSGPLEINNYNGAAIPDSSQLHNPQVETICRKYLELRYRMLPYLYSAVREATKTGMPVMRALWLHYPEDATAIARDDEYLWGRDLLVAPVVESGATTRRIYLPRGAWYDFWTNERHDGGREITREVDLETMPLFVRAGAVLPLGPVKQYVTEKVDQPASISIFPGADGAFLLYEDDGKSFDYRKGEWMGIQMDWNDARRVLRLQLAAGSRMLRPAPRAFEVKLDGRTKQIVFAGQSLEVKF